MSASTESPFVESPSYEHHLSNIVCHASSVGAASNGVALVKESTMSVEISVGEATVSRKSVNRNPVRQRTSRYGSNTYRSSIYRSNAYRWIIFRPSTYSPPTYAPEASSDTADQRLLPRTDIISLLLRDASHHFLSTFTRIPFAVNGLSLSE